MDLWDEENKRVKAKWDVILHPQQERRKEDEARLSRGGSLNSQDDDDAIVEAPKLIEAEIGGDKFELVQKQVQQQSIVLAQVANSFKESTEKTRNKLGEQNADLKKFQTSVIDALKSPLAPHRAHRGRDRGPPQAPRGADGRLALPRRDGRGHSWRRLWTGFRSVPGQGEGRPAAGREGVRGSAQAEGGPDDFGVEALNADVADDDDARRLKYAAGASAAAGRGRGRRRRRRCKGTRRRACEKAL